MPQATIKLQQAPAPATTVRKPAVSVASEAPKVETEGKALAADSKAGEPSLPDNMEEMEAGDVPSEIPIPLLIAAAVMALAALGIQIWTFIS